MSSMSQAMDAITAARQAVAAARPALRRSTITPRESIDVDGLMLLIRDCVSEAGGLFQDLAGAITFTCTTSVLPAQVHESAREVAACLRTAGVQVADGGHRPWHDAREIWEHQVRTPLRQARR